MSSQTVEQTPRISAYDVMKHGAMTLMDEHGALVHVNAKLAHKLQPFGGTRPFVICPQCQRRCTHLYVVGKVAICRLCGSLTYQSQRQDRPTRLVARAHRLRKQLARGDRVLATPKRPQGMHRRTYERILARIEELEDRAFEDWFMQGDELP